VKRKVEPADDGSYFHVILGTPDPDCEICRAHGTAGPCGPGILVEVRGLDDLLGCPCPLCRQARTRPL
jgi:hypothetical protein